MPSRKRTKGKARKAKAALRSNLIWKHGVTHCTHGCEPFVGDHICYRFMMNYESELVTVTNATIESNGTVPRYEVYGEVLKRLIKTNLYEEVFTDEGNQKMLLPMLLCLGTNYLLVDKSGYTQMAAITAIVALCSQHNFDLDRTLASSRKNKNVIRDLFHCGFDSDTTKFYMKMIPCNCLRDKYARVKSEMKQMVCTHCLVERERKDFLLCGGCRMDNYCSVECQRAAYPAHRSYCRRMQRLEKEEGDRRCVRYESVKV